jgi:hypothetical protein
MCLVYIYSNLKGYYEMYVKLGSNNIWVGLRTAAELSVDL